MTDQLRPEQQQAAREAWDNSARGEPLAEQAKWVHEAVYAVYAAGLRDRPPASTDTSELMVLVDTLRCEATILHDPDDARLLLAAVDHLVRLTTALADAGVEAQNHQEAWTALQDHAADLRAALADERARAMDEAATLADERPEFTSRSDEYSIGYNEASSDIARSLRQLAAAIRAKGTV